MSLTDKMARAFRGVPRAASARLDAWANAITGFGTDRDKTSYGYVTRNRFLSDEELSALYHGDDLAARMVDLVPEEMLRDGFCVETDEAELDQIIDEKLDELGAVDRFGEALRWERLFAGSAVLVGADDGRDASRPLKPEAARDISYLYTLDRRLLWPNSYYTEPGHPRLGLPETYLVTTPTAQGAPASVVHETRLIIFRGEPAAAYERIANSSWGVSVLQRAYEALRMYNTAWKAVEIMLTDSNQAVFKMANLIHLLGSKDGRADVQERMRTIDMCRSVIRGIVIDAGSNQEPAEEFARQSTSFDSIPQTMQQLSLRLAAAARTPATLLMGQSPAGLSATGESDLRWFYDQTSAARTMRLAPRLRRLTDIWIRTRAGQETCRKLGIKARERDGLLYPQTLTIEFPSLWTPTPKEEAERQKLVAEADAIRVTSQVFTPDEIALKRGRPEGYDGDIVLDDKSIQAREKALAFDLEQLASGEREDPNAAPSGPQQGSPFGPPTPAPAEGADTPPSG